MTPGTETRTTVPRSGHTRITRTALRRTVETITAQAFKVPAVNVAAELDDDSGKLGVRVSVQLAIPPLLGPRQVTGTVFERAQAARTEIVEQGLKLTGMELGRVDIRLTGAKQDQLQQRRVA
ncbi:hypothetical protein ACFRJ9_06995 [Paenarthrobacter sp. NPDC056912]|uniref:hypothetical protein n=1 Tax=Paenarthrobacter sp. NPDC056912 TaxID=3345965 RepID=UPI003670DA3E